MADPVIAIGGENLIDQVVLPDATTNHPGGSPFNVALAAARQGGVVRYVTPISTDVWGDMLATRLAEAGVQLAGGRVAQPSTMARVSLSDGLPSYSFRRTATAERQVSLASLTQSLGAGAAALHTGSLALIDGADAQAVAAELFAAPVALPAVSGLNEHGPLPSADGGDILLAFAVTADGKVTGLSRVDDNDEANGYANRLMRQLRKTPFRPRFDLETGEPVDTENLTVAYDSNT